jgi:hypothetical protein
MVGSSRVYGLAGVRDSVVHVHAGHVFAGPTVYVVTLAVLGLQEVVPGTAEQRVAARTALELVGAAGETVGACKVPVPVSSSEPRKPVVEIRAA